MCTHRNGNKYCKHVLSSLLNIIIMSLLIASTFKFYDNMECDKINVIPPECNNINGGMATGVNINKSNVIFKHSNNFTDMLKNICEIAKTKDVFMVYEQFSISPSPIQNNTSFLKFNPKTSFIFMLAIEILMIITLLIQFVLFAIEYYDEHKKLDYIYIE